MQRCVFIQRIRRNYKNVLWKTSILVIRGWSEWKIWCAVLSIGQTWTDIETAVKLCKGCALAAKAPTVKFGFRRPSWRVLLFSCRFSRWHEVWRCKNPTSEIVIKFIYELFARFGIAEASLRRKISDFCEIYQIKHITTTPFHSRSNGQSERFVDTLKRAFKRKLALQ